MVSSLKDRLYGLLRWSERYTKTDMVYLARGSFWFILSQFAAMAVSLVVAVAFGHFAPPDAYGNYRYVISLWGICSALSLSGIGIAVTQAAARGYEGALRQGFYLNLKWSAGTVLLALGLASYYLFADQNEYLAASLLIVAIFAPFLSSFSLFDPFLVGLKDFKRDSIYNILNNLLPAATLVSVLIFTHRAIVLVLTFFVANVLADAVFYFLARREIRGSRADPEMLRYSKSLSIMGIVNATADKVDSIMIFSFLGPANLAIYAFAIAMPEQIKQFGNIIALVGLPRFAERPFLEIRRTLWRRILLLVLGMSAALCAYILVAPLLFHLLFPNYLDSIGYSRWYAISIIFAIANAPLASVFQAHKKTEALYKITAFGAVFLIIVVPISVYYYGIVGAIVSQFFYRAITFGTAAIEFIRAE